MAMGSANVPAVPLNSVLEQAMLPSAEKVTEKTRETAMKDPENNIPEI